MRRCILQLEGRVDKVTQWAITNVCKNVSRATTGDILHLNWSAIRSDISPMTIS